MRAHASPRTIAECTKLGIRWRDCGSDCAALCARVGSGHSDRRVLFGPTSAEAYARVRCPRRSEQSATAKRCTGTWHYMCRERRAAAVTSLRCLSALQTGVHPDPTDPRKPSEQRLSAGSCVTGQERRPSVSAKDASSRHVPESSALQWAAWVQRRAAPGGVRSAAGRRARRYAGREQPHPHTQVEVQYV